MQDPIAQPGFWRTVVVTAAMGAILVGVGAHAPSARLVAAEPTQKDTGRASEEELARDLIRRAGARRGVCAFMGVDRGLAREVARQGIAVNAVAPGMMFTEMTAETLKANEAKYLSRIPLHRIAETTEIADVIVFLASERESYMTGATVDVSGGMLMR